MPTLAQHAAYDLDTVCFAPEGSEVAEVDGWLRVRVLWPAALTPQDIGVGVLVWSGEAYSPEADWVDAGEPVEPARHGELTRYPDGELPEAWTIVAARRADGCWVLTLRRPVE